MNEITAPIILILTIVFPGPVPDVRKQLSMPTIEECFAQAKEWDERGVTQEMSARGVVAVQAACRVTARPT